MNALLHCPERPESYNLYVTHMTCDRCAAHIIQAGIKRVVYSNVIRNTWGPEYDRAKDMYERANVNLVRLGHE